MLIITLISCFYDFLGNDVGRAVSPQGIVKSAYTDICTKYSQLLTQEPKSVHKLDQ